MCVAPLYSRTERTDVKVVRESRAVLILVAVALLVTALALGAADAWASEGDMSGMPGMTQEEMQNMRQPQASDTDGHGSETGPGSHTDMFASSANWFVVGGFLLLVAGTTVAAAVTKRHLRIRMQEGQLAGAGVQSV
jgi:hypothetical protein